MASRAAPKPARPAGKSIVKTPGKDQTKGDKQPANLLEIVPGKFNENDWLSLLENEDTEDFIADIFEGIWAETSKQIQQIYIRRQLLPYTLLITENALSNVIQWAFLERDEAQPTDGDFWGEDAEPIPCTMDNWGEGVVPSCREESSNSMEPITYSAAEQSQSIETNLQLTDDNESTPPPLTSSALDELYQTPRTTAQTKKPDKTKPIDSNQFHQIQDISKDHDKRSTTKNSFNQDHFDQLPTERQSYNHDILVIDTHPPKLEPLSNLFRPTPMYTSQSSSPNPTPATLAIKHRRILGPTGGSHLDSDDLASSTNLTETTMMKNLKKHESKFFDDQRVEEVIAKAPVAAHAILKSILSRPPGYRELELDDDGNVIAIAKLDPDKLGSRSVRVKCDVVKPRKAQGENRPAPPKQTTLMKQTRYDPKFVPVKLVLPEHSTEVGDLIQPVPGVLYEDSKLKKGDPRRYQTGMSKYTNFIDDSRPLRPIARRTDLAVLQVANQLLRKSKDHPDNSDYEHDLSIPKLHRLSRIPPIMSGSSTSTA